MQQTLAPSLGAKVRNMDNRGRNHISSNNSITKAYDVHQEAILRLQEVVGVKTEGEVVLWNDSSLRRAEHVIDAFRQAAVNSRVSHNS